MAIRPIPAYHQKARSSVSLACEWPTGANQHKGCSVAEVFVSSQEVQTSFPIRFGWAILHHVLVERLHEALPELIIEFPEGGENILGAASRNAGTRP